jgi:hypothetical protein
MIEGNKDEQINLKKQNIKLSNELEEIKNRMDCLNGEVGMRLALNNK